MTTMYIVVRVCIWDPGFHKVEWDLGPHVNTALSSSLVVTLGKNIIDI